MFSVHQKDTSSDYDSSYYEATTYDLVLDNEAIVNDVAFALPTFTSDGCVQFLDGTIVELLKHQHGKAEAAPSEGRPADINSQENTTHPKDIKVNNFVVGDTVSPKRQPCSHPPTSGSQKLGQIS